MADENPVARGVLGGEGMSGAILLLGLAPLELDFVPGMITRPLCILMVGCTPTPNSPPSPLRVPYIAQSTTTGPADTRLRIQAL